MAFKVLGDPDFRLWYMSSKAQASQQMYNKFIGKEHFTKGMCYCYLKMDVMDLQDSVTWDKTSHFSTLQKTSYAFSVNLYLCSVTV